MQGFPRADIDLAAVRADRHTVTGTLLCTCLAVHTLVGGGCPSVPGCPIREEEGQSNEYVASVL